MSIKGAIFDMDGTLLDSMPLWNTRGSDFLRENGLPPEPGIDRKFKVMSLRQAAEYFHDAYHVPGTVEEIMDRINAGVERGYRTVLPKPGVPEFLDRLAARGVGMLVATATDRYLVEGVLGRLGLLERFKGVLTCGEVGYGKSRPDIFLEAAARLGTSKEETVVFEDAPHAIRTAKAAGFRVCGVADASYAGDAEELRALCDWYVENFREALEAAGDF